MAQEFPMDLDEELDPLNLSTYQLPKFDQYDMEEDLPFELNQVVTSTIVSNTANESPIDELTQSASRFKLWNNNNQRLEPYPTFSDHQAEDYIALRSKLATPQPNTTIKPMNMSRINSVSQLDKNGTPSATKEEIEFIPPENFSPVISRIYRSSFPRPENFNFLKTIGLKSILILIPEEYPPENLQFVKDNNITIFQVGLSGNKEPFVNVPDADITKALTIALNPANHPLMIHCNRGKHRTGCLVGCIRRLQKWSLTMIFDEYRRFAAPKARPLDQQFIELYDETEIKQLATDKGWLPLEW